MGKQCKIRSKEAVCELVAPPWSKKEPAGRQKFYKLGRKKETIKNIEVRVWRRWIHRTRGCPRYSEEKPLLKITKFKYFSYFVIFGKMIENFFFSRINIWVWHEIS